MGEQLTLVNDDLEGVGVVEVTRIEFTTFGAVPRSFALAESEGDASIEEWRAGHRRFWEGDGLAVTDEMPVMLIYFKLVSAATHDPMSSTK